MKHDTISDGWGERYLEKIKLTGDEWNGSAWKARDVILKCGIALIIGKRGTGKTQIAAEISRQGCFPDDLTRQSKTSCYRRASEIFIQLLSAKSTNESEERIIKDLTSFGLLTIDELHDRGMSNWENRIITLIIDRRYSDMLPTVLIANIRHEELGNVISDSVISRICECGGVIQCDNKSFRS